MTATFRNSLGIAALAVISVSAVALTSAPARNTIATVGHAVSVAYRAAIADVHAQDAGGPQPPFFGRGRGGPGGPGGRAGGPGGRFGGPGRGGPGGPMGALGPIMRLDLTDAQRDQIKTIVESNRPDSATLERTRAAHDALEAAVTSDTFDEGTIRAASAEVANVEADMVVAQARLRAAVLQILTPEQRTQLKEMQAKMTERRSR